MLSKADGSDARTIASGADNQLALDGWTYDGKGLYVEDHKGNDYYVDVFDARSRGITQVRFTLDHPPAYVTQAEAGAGFAELARFLVDAR